ncbi:AAA family ATPase [Pedobacter jamesrossensis]|uniref:AAA family ATPase n=1 Tax=Pedobacter jamesrossensis TaxID=1908238 RepID=UPI00360BEAF9
MNELHVPGKSLKSFVLTQEFNRFEEFASSCIDFRYIGICYGEPGVGKSLAAARFTQWQEELIDENAVDELSAKRKKVIKNCKGAFLTAPVTNTPKIIKTEITRRTSAYGITLAKANMESDLYKIVTQANQLCPLVIIDEADRLNINALEEVRSLYDQYQFGLIFIGMTGIEKRFSRYPQLYSRIGFSHEFKRLSEDEMRFIFPKIWSNMGLKYNSDYFSDVEALNTIVRITAGNFRLIDRLFSQITRIIKINKLQCINKDVVEAARKCLIIG